MRLYDVHTLAQAYSKIKENFDNFKTETVTLDKAFGRVLSEDVVATVDVPTFRRSTVDGYALVASDTNGASDTMPMLLESIGEVEMGHSTSRPLKEGQLMYVPTGGMVPEGANAMVMIEYTEKFSEDTIAILKQTLPLQHIVKVGDDVKAGSVILKKGMKLSSRHIGVLAATGAFDVKVYKRLKVGIISTGDELITTQQSLNEGEVFDINTHTLKNHSLLFDLEVIETSVLKDDRKLIQSTIEQYSNDADIVLISGGSSVGHKDYTADIIEELSGQGGLLLHGLAIKPGKPTIVGKVNGSLVLGLPGHPVSALIVYDQLIRMYLKPIFHYKAQEVKGYLTKNVHAAAGKETFVMVSMENDQVVPVLGKSSMITMMSLADGYIKIEANDEGLSSGDLVTVYLME